MSSTDGEDSLSSSQESLCSYSGVHHNDDDLSEPPAKKSRGRINIFTDRVVAVLDKCHVSDEYAVHLVAAIADALNIDIGSLTLNRSSI